MGMTQAVSFTMLEILMPYSGRTFQLLLLSIESCRTFPFFGNLQPNQEPYYRQIDRVQLRHPMILAQLQRQ